MDAHDCAEQAARHTVEAYRRALRREPDIEAVVVTEWRGDDQARETSSFWIAGQEIYRPNLEVDLSFHPDWIDYFRLVDAPIGTKARVTVCANDDSSGYLIESPVQ